MKTQKELIAELSRYSDASKIEVKDDGAVFYARDLDLSNTQITALPDDLQVGGCDTQIKK